ncbi:MAG TPA: VWA domain-containing protein [Nannocystaceae bacterium]|nr:VWA domain-containing protein [Nannocystaceae bacterium]
MILRSCLVAAALCVLGCEQNVHDDLGEPHTFAEVTRTIFGPYQTKKLDVLLVVDDSAEMAGFQANIAANLPAFIAVLEHPEVAVDYRFGVTTTSVEHPVCADVVDAGALRLSSCRERLGDFADGTECMDTCTFDAIRTVPTTTAEDPMPRPRPWIESRGGVSNLEAIAGIVPSTIEALQCTGLQGVAGCEFPSPLEAMHRALLRMQDMNDPQYGFLRDDAALLALILTNGNDCSLAPDRDALFVPASAGGNPVFWSDPRADAPTRAACWNAGVECTGGPEYDECHSANHAGTGQPDVADEDAVLQPISRYVALLEGIEASKQAIDPGLQVIVELIAGVPGGYEDGQSEIAYADATDPAEQIEWGIGAGCVRNAAEPPATARPPVRELAVAEATQVGDTRGAVSICADDYSPALGAIASTIRDQIKPACMPTCVADADPDTAELEPTCHVDWSASSSFGVAERGVVRACNPDETVPEGEDVCAVTLVGENVSDYCSDSGWNLEFRFVQRDGWRWPEGTIVTATCLVSLEGESECSQSE